MISSHTLKSWHSFSRPAQCLIRFTQFSAQNQSLIPCPRASSSPRLHSLLSPNKGVLRLVFLGWWQMRGQGQVPRSDAWGIEHGVGREQKCLGMQQSSTGAIGLKARMFIDQLIPIIDAAWRSFERWSWGREWGFMEKAIIQPDHSEYK